MNVSSPVARRRGWDSSQIGLPCLQSRTNHCLGAFAPSPLMQFSFECGGGLAAGFEMGAPPPVAPPPCANNSDPPRRRPSAVTDGERHGLFCSPPLKQASNQTISREDRWHGFQIVRRRGGSNHELSAAVLAACGRASSREFSFPNTRINEPQRECRGGSTARNLNSSLPLIVPAAAGGALQIAPDSPPREPSPDDRATGSFRLQSFKGMDQLKGWPGDRRRDILKTVRATDRPPSRGGASNRSRLRHRSVTCLSLRGWSRRVAGAGRRGRSC